MGDSEGLAMDTSALALQMKRLSIWLDRSCQPEGLVRRQFATPPFGSCYLTLDPARQAPFASSNYNRIHVCGTEPGLEPDGIERLIQQFQAAGVRRFFVWLSPGPDMHTVRGWLDRAGFSQIRRTGYPTLHRGSTAAARFTTDLQVREVTPDEIAGVRDLLGDTLAPEYARSAGKPGFFHFMAFDGARPVAIASLCAFEGLGYLMAAATAESDRKRGAQQALIAGRIARAAQVGCSALVSETLYMLEHSYRNLQRAGFQEAYEKEVYEWSSPESEEDDPQ
jgi:N-acetylglutamate synthase-like GNAT family acetyltransferase